MTELMIKYPSRLNRTTETNNFIQLLEGLKKLLKKVLDKI